MASFVTDGQHHNESKESAEVEGTVADGEMIQRKKKLGVSH